MDVHSRGIILVATILKDAGIDVVFLGNAMPEEIIRIAIQQGVDIIGISSLGGSHLTLGKELINIAPDDLFSTVSFVIGGVFPSSDIHNLKYIGFDAVFTSSNTCEEIINTIKGLRKVSYVRRCA